MRIVLILFCTLSLHAVSSSMSGQKIHDEAVRQLLPEHDKDVVEFKKLPGGLSNDVTLCTTALGNSYIFRQAKKLDNKDRFNKVLSLAQRAAHLKMAPEIYGANDVNQHILMKYIPHVAWPAYETNEQPYIATMKLLRAFHDKMRVEIPKEPNSFEPFSAVLRRTKRLLNNPTMPKQLKVAFDKIKVFQETTLPWLVTHATIYHGDFKKDNVLLEQQENTLRPWLIDFDSMNRGHPYFDVVKFSLKLPPEQRASLFQVYLGRTPTIEEAMHFDILDNTLRMLIATIRFDRALQEQNVIENSGLLSKEEMEELLDSGHPLPSQSTISLQEPDPRKQQLAALYALHDFLKNS